MRRALALILTITSAVVVTGCAKVDQGRDKVIQALDRTEQMARDFMYTEEAGGHRTVVTGSVEDDLRYRVEATVDGSPAGSEIVLDDARALRVTDPALLARMTAVKAGFGAGTPAPVPTTSASPAPGASASPAPGASPSPAAVAAVPDALKSGGWVVDKKGATTVVATSGLSDVVGANPLADSITALEYIRRALREAQSVDKFNPESETYRPKLDPFPRPAAGVVRYDLVPRVLKASNKGGNGQLEREVPDNAFFRVMSLYIRDGVIIEAREKIDVELRLRDPQSNLEARVGDYAKMPDGTSLHDQVGPVLTALNTQLTRTGRPPIRQRTLDLQFTSLGHSGTVELPAGATEGSLAAVAPHGQLLYERQ